MSRVVSTSKMAPNWLHKSEQPFRSQVSKLTQLLTMTTTHKFPPQDSYLHHVYQAVRKAGGIVIADEVQVEL